LNSPGPAALHSRRPGDTFLIRRDSQNSKYEAIPMRKLLVAAAVIAAFLAAGSCRAQLRDNFVLVKGGTFKNTKSNYFGKGVTISDFYLGKYDVTQKEWTEVMGSNPSRFTGDDLPVEMVNWYDAIEYCNKRSLHEGLQPYYNIDKDKKDPNNLPNPKFGELDQVKWTVTTNPAANGYRLPTEAEWEYAASGGQLSRSYLYSGSDNVDEVAWYWKNSGDKPLDGYWRWPTLQQNHNRTQPVGGKKPNELGLYDMSGNVREWCWDWSGDLTSNAANPQGTDSGFSRVWRGGGWMGAEFAATTAFRGSLAANGKGPDQGFRVARNK
jgi:formylglycine-generating enzyme required for sulfatase activity